MKGIIRHKNSLLISGAMSFFISNLPVWAYDGVMQKIGIMLTVFGAVYVMIWLEGGKDDLD